MRDFFRDPEKSRFQLSPDGTRLAFLMPWEGRLNVHVQEVGGETATRITEATERSILGFGWANNQRIVYILDQGGDENYHAYAVDIDGSNFLDLTPFEGVRSQIVDILEDDDEEMILSMNDRDPRVFDVYRVNVDTGERTLIAENPGNIMGWGTDNDGKLRIAVATDGVNQSILYRKTESEPFETVVTTDFRETIQPLHFTFDDRYLYVSSNIGRDKQAIFRYDPETNEHLEMIYEHPEVDVDVLLRSKARKVITGVAYSTDKRGYHFFDDHRERIQERLETALPGYEVVISSSSRDESKLLVRTFSDKSLGAYYHYDVEHDALTKLVDVSPWLDEDELCDMEPIEYAARDGLTIHGYLTLPAGTEPRNLPAVVLVHGGPWHRDNWGFNPEVQFLANRGYAVLQVNFRGSTGYGKEFWTSSFKQWGRAMQDDVTDGVRWLIDRGIADPERIGIYGGSYGGYATLAGLAFTPELYACGVDYVGVSNIFTFLESFPPYWELGRQMIYEMVGDPEEDRELLEQVSPYFHADRIRAPLFVAQGANDPRVKKAESDQIVEALQARGIDVPYMVKEDEGHGFYNEENKFDFYGAMERFLAEHLGGRAEETSAAPEG
ncbi:MAG: prolyl oligopeptidase family serine peptidase [Candidatus Eisenbacteria bacterium]|nr:prolyl oligopeptidase family serine peptidase [Candidatus Latescibacterota bacterium]MBD3301946.1 prolyl oligopeptidase family serine peptidase [Candidatus Eisenbacteria bacterium]